MIATGAIWAALAVAASTDVEITKPSGKRVAVTIAGHPETKEYRYEGEPKVGVSLAAVLKDVGIGDRAWTTITAEGLTVQNGSFANRKPPIFFMKRDDVAFYKPKSKDSPASQRTAQGQFFAMSFRVPLEVEASDNSPKAGQTVTYEAVVPDGGPQSAFEFRWVPSSGSPSTTDKFEYTYPETSGEVTINVTAKRVSDGEVVGTAATGETVEAPPASSGTGGTGTTGTGFGTGPSFGTDSYTPPSGDFDTNFPDVGDSSSDFPDAPKAPKTDITPTEETGTPVTGELLSATGAPPPSSGDAAEPLPAAGEDAPSDPTEVSEEAKEVSAPGALIASGIIVGLLGLGAGREMENVRPRRLRRPDLSGLRRLSPPWK
jgi:hypothetical protein